MCFLVLARGRRQRTQDEVFAEGSCFGSSINLPKQDKWIVGEKSTVSLSRSRGERHVSLPHLSSGDSEGFKGPTCLSGNLGGFSIGVGTTRLAASGLE